MEVAELFDRLESNQPEIVEETKKIFHEIFHTTKESWLVNGLCDYCLSTNSSRSVEILVGVREPHDKHLFDRLSDSLKGPSKLQALTLLGHIVRRNPAWIYKIAQHALLKDLLKLLKVETDILPLMSALLVLIVLLPMIPALIGCHLQDIFEVFSRLAAWNTNNPNKLLEEHLLHLQAGLYTLFHRLYGMYPCNFLSYLRNEYGQRENLGIFSHTIKPMLDTVKMHPLLVTASKEAETGTARWKKMELHDVIVECAKYSALDPLERPREEVSSQGLPPTLWPRYSNIESAYQHQIKGNPTLNLPSSQMTPQEEWSPSVFYGVSTPPLEETAPTSIPQTPNSQSYIVSSSLPHQEGTSPPEAAIEATPETTPIKETRHLGRHPPVNSSVARALTSFSGTKWAGVTSGSATPTQSQPSSPMKKEPSPFRFPAEGSSSFKSAFEQPRRDSIPSAPERRDSLSTQLIQRMQMDRIQVTESLVSNKQTAPNVCTKVSGVQPASPLRCIGNEIGIPNSPVHMEPTAPVPGGKEWLVAKPVPEKNGFDFESAEVIGAAPLHIDSSQDDQEILEIVKQGEHWSIDTQLKQVSVQLSQRQCDSVLQEFHPSHMDDYEECQQESGSSCTSGGLHMPTGHSIREIALLVHQQHRQRFYSQCTPDTKGLGSVGFSTGSSPGEGSAFPLQVRVRRANSCPEMKKGPVLPAAEANVDKTLEEKEEFEESDGIVITVGSYGQRHAMNGRDKENGHLSEEPDNVTSVKQMASSSTQTVDNWNPLPYEHLLEVAFPLGEQYTQSQNGEVKPSPAPSPAPLSHHTESFPRYSPYTMLDKYIETVIQGHAKKPKVQGLESELKAMKEQLTLLNIQLQFERHRREALADRNRRLLGKSRSNRALEEHNSALRDQLSLLQKDIENLHIEREKKKKEMLVTEQQFRETISYWENQCNIVQKENKELRIKNELLEQELRQTKEKTVAVTKECQKTESAFFEIGNEMQQAVAQASAVQQLRSHIEQLQKELILMGELQQKYRDRFSHLPLLRQSEDELTHLQNSYHEEIKGVNEMLDLRNSTLEAAKARIAELESVITRRDMIISDQKRVLEQVKEEYQEKLESVESKYQTHRSITQRMESHILELLHKLSLAENTSMGKNTRSPDSSAAHEVSVSSAGSADKPLGPSGFSPHSSPLSESLGSAEGSLSDILSGEGVEMKNLQVIVDQPEQPSTDQHQLPRPAQQFVDSDMAAAGNSTPEEEG